MDDNELNTDSPSSSVSVSYSESDFEDSGNENFVFEGNFLPYQGEPLASSEGSSDEEQEDLDGLTRDILEQRYERRIPVQTWYVVKKTMLTFLVSENR